jgi:ribose/xylose/arabinose/galactoside ABC-type transport system permease subunit
VTLIAAKPWPASTARTPRSAPSSAGARSKIRAGTHREQSPCKDPGCRRSASLRPTFIALPDRPAWCIFFATTDRFFSGDNFSLILQQVTVVGVIAIGQTLIILTAGIDLSCGMMMALGSIVMTKLAADLGLPAPLAILCGHRGHAGFGLVNGLLVTRIKLPPFIVTLGTLNIAFAITQLYSPRRP